VAAELFHADGRTDRKADGRTDKYEANRRFSQFCEKRLKQRKRDLILGDEREFHSVFRSSIHPTLSFISFLFYFLLLYTRSSLYSHITRLSQHALVAVPVYP
jgi:hypothetical protein